MEITTVRIVATVVVLVGFWVLLWLAWKVAVFLFMLWIIIGVASAAMKGSP